MAVSIPHFSHSPLSPPPPPPPASSSSSSSFWPFRSPSAPRISRGRIVSASSHMEPQNGGRRRFMEFPYVSAPHRDLMLELVSTMETRIDSHLLPFNLLPDVQYYQNQSGTAQASLHVRSGNNSSPIDFIFGSWLHCELPSGVLNITSFSAYLNPSTDAPHFLIEFIQSSPTSLILLLDLPPRKDLVLDPDYLHTFYEDTQLDGRRRLLEKIPEVRPYFSSSLYVRCVFSPTAILVCIETNAGETRRMDEIVRDHVGPIAKEVLGIWLDRCARGEREVEETERAYLEKRDRLIKSKAIDIDLGSSLPRLFGEEVAGRILGVIREVYNV